MASQQRRSLQSWEYNFRKAEIFLEHPYFGYGVLKIVLFATLRSKYKARELIVTCDGTFLNLVENASKILG
jgi:hypothetical protein